MANKSELQIFSPIQWKYITPELTIYENPKYEKVITFLHNNKDKLNLIGGHILYNRHSKSINQILERGELCPKDYNKFLYHLCLFSYDLREEEKDVDFLKDIKRIRWIEPLEEHKRLTVERLKLLKQSIDNHPLDIEKEKNNFL
jgi:hypothetical protein